MNRSSSECLRPEPGSGSGDRMHTDHRLPRLTFRERFQICACLGGAMLPCGCVTGRDLTYAGDQMTVIDHAAPRCRDAAHRLNVVVARTPARE